MDIDTGLLRRTALFHGMEDGDIRRLLDCLHCPVRRYGRGEFLWHAGDAVPMAGIVLSGCVDAVQYGEDGGAVLTVRQEKGGVFGDLLMAAGQASPLSLVASAEGAEVLFLPLEGKTLEELMPAFGEKTRYNIRLSARKGVTTRWAGAEELEAFFRIYLETCERDGIGHRPLDYFQRMLEAYGPERCRVCLAEYEGEPLAAAIALHYGRKVFYIYGASSNEKRNLMPAYAMQAEMIRWACSLGVDFYDFGGVYSLSKENGLYRFKEGFCHSVGVTELAGEFDQVLSPFWYWAFLRGKPLLQKLRARRKK
jgi:lipid II:glycine glycyltransferase (peptidoglycan interpeptide bridge formation enzyme)